MKSSLTVGLLLGWLGVPGSAHRLDEYLQATTIALAPHRVQAQIRLTPGVAVFPAVVPTIDLNRDGLISSDEQRAYAERVLGDLSLTLDGEPLKFRLSSAKFPGIDEMKEGRGEITNRFRREYSARPLRTSTRFRKSSPAPDRHLLSELPGAGGSRYSGNGTAAKL